jgi:hypothetical protein
MNPDYPPPDPEPDDSFGGTDRRVPLIATFTYDSAGRLMTLVYDPGHDPAGAAPLRFGWEYDPETRLYALTGADGQTEYWRDNPTRYLVVEPDPTTGTIRPVLERGRPVCLWLCREQREAR